MSTQRNASQPKPSPSEQLFESTPLPLEGLEPVAAAAEGAAAGPDADAPSAADTPAAPVNAPEAKPAPKRTGRKRTARAKVDAAGEQAAGTTADAAADAEREAKRAAAEKLLHEKNAVRTEALARRQQLRPATRSARSREVCNQLLSQLQTSGIKGRDGQPPTLAVYAAMRFEIDLDRFIRGAYALGYRIVFPCMIPNDRARGGMCMRSVSCLNYIGGSVPFIVDPRKPWGPAVTEEHQALANTPSGSTRRFIPSRVKGSIPPKDDTRFPVVAPAEIDMAIVPAVAFDAEGNRLGYGTGVYDRYLPQLHEGCRLIGVAFTEQQMETVPHGEHDIRLPQFITA